MPWKKPKESLNSRKDPRRTCVRHATQGRSGRHRKARTSLLVPIPQGSTEVSHWLTWLTVAAMKTRTTLAIILPSTYHLTMITLTLCTVEGFSENKKKSLKNFLTAAHLLCQPTLVESDELCHTRTGSSRSPHRPPHFDWLTTPK